MAKKPARPAKPPTARASGGATEPTTTVAVGVSVHRALRIAAAEHGTTVKELVERFSREGLARLGRV